MRERGSKKGKGRREFLFSVSALLTALCLVLASMTGCAVKEEEPDDGRMKVVTTIFPP